MAERMWPALPPAEAETPEPGRDGFEGVATWLQLSLSQSFPLFPSALVFQFCLEAIERSCKKQHGGQLRGGRDSHSVHGAPEPIMTQRMTQINTDGFELWPTSLPSPHLHPGDGTDGQCSDKKYGWMGKSFKQISMDGWMDVTSRWIDWKSY